MGMSLLSRRTVASCAALGVLLTSVAVRAQDPELNPFECLGRYEAATGNRAIAQIDKELERRVELLREPNEPRTVRAVKHCVIGQLKARLGHADAAEHFERAISLNEKEPGWELFAGNYWSGARGAQAPVLELAERHYYRALRKLDALRRERRFRDYHSTVEEWVRKRLLVLYQQDGLPLLPWKAYPQDGSGLNAPGLSLAAGFDVAKDTRDFFHNSEMRTFTGEAAFAASDLRAGAALDDVAIYELARAPLRHQLDLRGRARHNAIGALDAIYTRYRAEESQITSFYEPNRNFADVAVDEFGGAYHRVFPLYPLFDLRAQFSYRRVSRTGAIEFLPERRELFDLFEAKPAISRFLGSDKLTLSGVYALLDVTDVKGGVPAERLREKWIRGATLEYALYSPLVLPSLQDGSLRPYRAPIRGWYFYGGFLQDDEVYGLRTVTRRDYYGGTRFEGPANYDFTLQGTYYTSHTAALDVNELSPVLRTDPSQTFSSFRSTVVLQRRLVNPDVTPGLPSSAFGFAPDMLNLVVPVSHEFAVTGPSHYENIRAGAELWWKVFGTGVWGTTVLFTVGYDYQYFYQITKALHMAHASVRVGWGDL
jgi:hypothetical protein